MTDKCPECKEYIFMDLAKHRCKPIFYVKCPADDPDHEGKFRASDHEEAAEKYAEAEDEYDSNFEIAGKGGEITLEVRNEAGVIKKFKVRGECVPQYYADEIEEEVTNAGSR